MPAPKSPNVAGAAAARRRIGDQTAANRLFTAGYLVLSPEELAQLPDDVKSRLRTWLASMDLVVPRALHDDRPPSPPTPATTENGHR